jgi:murein DD-endopeptidase MepM/ murein hydrolase activator NlpD
MKEKNVRHNKIASQFIAIRQVASLYLLLALCQLSWADTQMALPQDSRVPGGLAVIPLTADQAQQDVFFNEKPVWKIQQSNQAWAIIGIPLSQKIGKVDYKIGKTRHSFLIQDKAYKEQHLTVKKKHSNPSEKQLKRIRKESALSRKAFNEFSNINTEQAFNGFLIPAEGPISSPFGLKRFFNNQARRPHSGIDIAAPRGADIIAPAAGKIILTGNFFFNGNSIFIDHGQGLITMYCHMDELDSKQGQWVKRGDLIGKIGSTGRATGPHLHWTVSLNNSRIEPLLFLAPNQLPKNQSK